MSLINLGTAARFNRRLKKSESGKVFSFTNYNETLCQGMRNHGLGVVGLMYIGKDMCFALV